MTKVTNQFLNDPMIEAKVNEIVDSREWRSCSRVHRLKDMYRIHVTLVLKEGVPVGPTTEILPENLTSLFFVEFYDQGHNEKYEYKDYSTIRVISLIKALEYLGIPYLCHTPYSSNNVQSNKIHWEAPDGISFNIEENPPYYISYHDQHDGTYDVRFPGCSRIYVLGQDEMNKIRGLLSTPQYIKILVRTIVDNNQWTTKSYTHCLTGMINTEIGKLGTSPERYIVSFIDTYKNMTFCYENQTRSDVVALYEALRIKDIDFSIPAELEEELISGQVKVTKLIKEEVEVMDSKKQFMEEVKAPTLEDELSEESVTKDKGFFVNLAEFHILYDALLRSLAIPEEYQHTFSFNHKARSGLSQELIDRMRGVSLLSLEEE